MLILTDGSRDNASARIRAILYIPYFKQRGFHVKLIPRVPEKSSGLFYRFCLFPIIKRWYYLKRELAIKFQLWDIIFIQRTFLDERHLKLFKKRNAKIFYDFDDAVYINPEKLDDRNRTDLMIKYADEVITSTDNLNDFCIERQKNPVIIPSPVDTEYIKPSIKSIDHVFTIGWIGSSSTTVHLKMLEIPLRKLAKLYLFRFLTVGAKLTYQFKGVNHINKPWSFNDEARFIGEMDIGIMPLYDTEYTRSKGGYKLFQYMSAGIPCVASPVGINNQVIKPGINGYLASSEDEWFTHLEKLINNPSLRSELGKNGRIDALELYNRDVCFDKLIDTVLGHTGN